ncbi:DNA ligase [Vibrio phage vB_VpaS_MAR10]|uniref:DNA ligase n=1 Tax=Vibrio phage vB_VpaS_MAR10 TaxID=1229755 RepID=K7R2D7_9CAUD|nr:DNA ligase [Vibrio phage vB_VpaS_MAR10]AFV81244.1 DNA ligase [Vibrio phage vB_VpaS_MAR10]AXH68458.1 DNA ligase [Vibrio phage R01]
MPVVTVRRTSPIIALQFTGDNHEEVIAFLRQRGGTEVLLHHGNTLKVGSDCFLSWTVRKGDWLVHEKGSVCEVVFEDFFPDSYHIIKSGPFFGKKVVVSGTFREATRHAIKDLLLSSGAEVYGSVNKFTDILVCGKDAGSKLTKAKELGIEIIYESEILSLLK